MSASAERQDARAVHPLHAVLLAGALPLFLGGLLSDLGYGKTAEPQWSNFASWLIAGAMVLTGFALLWALIALLRRHDRPRWLALCTVLLLVTFILGLIDSFVHARDAWGIMPTAPVLSAIVALLAAAATWAGFSSLARGEAA